MVAVVPSARGNPLGSRITPGLVIGDANPKALFQDG
jgi:hypothetical protein